MWHFEKFCIFQTSNSARFAVFAPEIFQNQPK
jgi:hypothetical protein